MKFHKNSQTQLEAINYCKTILTFAKTTFKHSRKKLNFKICLSDFYKKFVVITFLLLNQNLYEDFR